MSKGSRHAGYKRRINIIEGVGQNAEFCFYGQGIAPLNKTPAEFKVAVEIGGPILIPHQPCDIMLGKVAPDENFIRIGESGSVYP